MLPERRWTLVRLLSRQDGNLLHKPLDPSQVRALAVSLLAATTGVEVFKLGRKKLIVAREEVAALVAAIDSGEAVAADGLIRRPHPAPDLAYGASHHASGLYTKETLRQLVEHVFINALLIYQELVDTWFPKLKRTLGLACLLPVGLSGSLVTEDDDAAFGGPSLVYETAPLPAGDAMKAEVRWVDARQGIGVSWANNAEEREKLRNLIGAYRPHADGWAHPHASYGILWVYGDRPATRQAYLWLAEDLHRLKLVERRPSIEDD